jgi:RHS repeat-associated protein
MWGTATYSVDGLGNMREVTVTTGANARHTVLNYDATTNRVTSLSGSSALNFGYDSQGNLSTRGSAGYVFDQGNRLSSATGKASYVYDGWGHRVKEAKVDGTNVIQVYSRDGQLLYGSSAVGAATPVESRYVYLKGHLLAEAGGNFVHTDGLGSPVARTNAAKSVVSRTRYEPYGLTATGTVPTTIGFTGHVNDADTGLVYMQQRYYDPVAARFMSTDPVLTDADTGGSFNRYAYVNNNPYKYVDPDGRDPYSSCGQCNRLAKPGQETIGDGVRSVVQSDAFTKLTEPLVGPELAAVSGGIRFIAGLSKVETALSDATVVCRGGSCTKAAFEAGKGVTIDAASGKLEGISTGIGKTVQEAASNIPHPKVGVTTVGEIKAAGGKIVNDHGNHANVSGLTAEKAAEIFKNVEKNPNK